MKKIILNILVLLTVVSLSSCLKDKTIIGPDSPGSVGAIIEFANPDYIVSGSATGNVKLARYVLTATRGTASQLHFRVNYVGTGTTAPQDVTVNLGVDNDAVAAHNAQLARTPATNNMFVQIPAAWYTMPTSVVIPKGAGGADFNVTINTTNFLTTTPAKSLYVLPLKITGANAGTISGNFGTIIVNVLAP